MEDGGSIWDGPKNMLCVVFDIACDDIKGEGAQEATNSIKNGLRGNSSIMDSVDALKGMKPPGT